MCIMLFPGRLLTPADKTPPTLAILHMSREPGFRDQVSTAFNLTRALIKSLMKSRMLNEETLSLSVSEIQVWGKRADSSNLLCTAPCEECLFSVPLALAEQLAGSQEVVQVTMDLAVNPFPYNDYMSSAVSTHLALLEFTTPEGAPISVAKLPKEWSISLRLPTGKQKPQNFSQTHIVIPPEGSVNFTVKVVSGSSPTGTHIHLSVTVLKGKCGSKEEDGKSSGEARSGASFICFLVRCGPWLSNKQDRV